MSYAYTDVSMLHSSKHTRAQGKSRGSDGRSAQPQEMMCHELQSYHAAVAISKCRKAGGRMNFRIKGGERTLEEPCTRNPEIQLEWFNRAGHDNPSRCPVRRLTLPEVIVTISAHLVKTPSCNS